MVLCAAYNCNVRSGHGKTLFSFPKDQDLCRKWVERLKTKDYWPSKHSRLCECHFDDDQFIWNRLIAKDAGYSKLLLKPEAIPSVFDYTPRVHKRGHKRKSEPSPGDEGTPIPTKTPKRRMAVLKRRALKFLSSTDENDLTEIVPSATESPICTMMDSSTIPDSDTSEEIQTSFDVFCQTSYGLISNEVKNSYAMELEGLKRCLSWLEENNILISDLVTDRHSQVKKFMKTERPDIEHWFDCWHVAKGVYKKLEAAGRKKGSEAVGEWARSVSNHLYWCASSSEGNGELVQQKWLSILNHVTDIHEGHGSLFERCQHEELSDRNWMRKGSKSHMEMEKVVKGRLLLTDVKKLSPAEQTSGLEAFHKVVCHFAPKLVHFFHAQMEARLFLAALHFNENSEREQRLTKDGRLQYAVSYPKGRDHDGISKEVKEPMTYEYVDRLMEEVIFQRETHTSYAIASQKRQLEQLRPTPISQSREHRPKELVVAERIHRFN